MPAWLSFDPNAFSFTGTPPYIGVFNFTIVVTDGLGGFAY